MCDYLGMSIDEVLCSQYVLIRAIGVLDRRVGKRKLRRLALEAEHPLVRLLYCFRCDAEGLSPAACHPATEEVDFRRPVLPWSRDKKKEAEGRRKAVVRLGDDKKARRQPALIAQSYQGALAAGNLENAIAKEIHAGFARVADRDILQATLRYVESKSKLLRSAVHARGVVELTCDAAHWVRPLEQWVTRSHNPDLCQLLSPRAVLHLVHGRGNGQGPPTAADD